MVKGELEKAHQLAKEKNGKPKIRSIRLSYWEQFQYPLSSYLDHLNWAFLDNENNIPERFRGSNLRFFRF